MANRLKTIIQLTGIASGASPSSAHNLNVGGLAVVPDEVKLSNPEFTFISADDTNVVVRNDGAGVGDCDVLVEHWHTVERVFGAAQTKELSPQPFNAAAGGGGGAESFIAVFGNAIHGSQVLSGDLGPDNEWFFQDLDTNGFDVQVERLFVRGTLTIRSGSRVHQDGADAVGPTGGNNRISQVTGTGGDGPDGTGGDGVAGVPGSSNQGWGGNGGAGGSGAGGVSPGGAGGSNTILGNMSDPFSLFELISGRSTGQWSPDNGDYVYIQGGASGGTGGGNRIEPPGDREGGGGGGGGMVQIICARNIVIEAGAFISANGGDGGAGEDVDCGGGGGGGGGVVLICYESMVNNGTIEAIGGAGGASGGGTGVAGSPGSAQAFQGGVYLLKTTPP
jgi:hypothetical protein